MLLNKKNVKLCNFGRLSLLLPLLFFVSFGWLQSQDAPQPKRDELIVETGAWTIKKLNNEVERLLGVAYRTSDKETVKANEVVHFLYKMKPSLVPVDGKSFAAALQLLPSKEGLFDVFWRFIENCSGLSSIDPDLNYISEYMQRCLNNIAAAVVSPRKDEEKGLAKAKVVHELLCFMEVKDALIEILGWAFIDKKMRNDIELKISEEKLKASFSAVALKLSTSLDKPVSPNMKMIGETYRELKKMYNNFLRAVAEKTKEVVAPLNPFVTTVVKNSPNEQPSSLYTVLAERAEKSNGVVNDKKLNLLLDGEKKQMLGFSRRTKFEHFVEGTYGRCKKGGKKMLNRLKHPLFGGPSITSAVFFYSAWWLVSFTQAVYSFLPSSLRIKAFESMFGCKRVWGWLDYFGIPAEDIVFFNPLKLILNKGQEISWDYASNELVKDDKEENDDSSSLLSFQKIEESPVPVLIKKGPGVIPTICKRISYLNWLMDELLKRSKEASAQLFVDGLSASEKITLLGALVQANKRWYGEYAQRDKRVPLIRLENESFKKVGEAELPLVGRPVIGSLVFGDKERRLDATVWNWFSGKLVQGLPQLGNKKAEKEVAASAQWAYLKRFVEKELVRAQNENENGAGNHDLKILLALCHAKINKEERALNEHWSYLANILRPWSFFAWRAKCDDIYHRRLLCAFIENKLASNKQFSIGDMEKSLADQVRKDNEELFNHQMTWRSFFVALPRTFLNWFSLHRDLENKKNWDIQQLSLLKRTASILGPKEPLPQKRIEGLKLIKERLEPFYKRTFSLSLNNA